MLIGEFEKGANVSPTLPFSSLLPCPIFTLCQETKAKSYQSTAAAAAAMDNAVEQTSKFVHLLTRPHCLINPSF
jgi:hypothetical protein